MKLIFEISDSDIEYATKFYDSMRNNQFVKQRIIENIKKPPNTVSNELFWYRLVCALLTTQQRSGPGSATYEFIHENPFPLSLDKIKHNKKNINEYAVKQFLRRKGIRSYNRISGFLSDNYHWLSLNGWECINQRINHLIQHKTQRVERDVSVFLSEKLKGIGPKQSRNLLQMIGLTKYEIPIDSRITKWLNSFGFPIRLSSTALSDEAYYEFVNDAVIAICEKINVYPCELDAAIFASYDGDKWNILSNSK